MQLYTLFWGKGPHNGFGGTVDYKLFPRSNFPPSPPFPHLSSTIRNVTVYCIGNIYPMFLVFIECVFFSTAAENSSIFQSLTGDILPRDRRMYIERLLCWTWVTSIRLIVFITFFFKCLLERTHYKHRVLCLLFNSTEQTNGFSSPHLTLVLSLLCIEWPMK